MSEATVNPSELAEEPAGNARRSHESVCPGLQSAAHWDGPEALRGELYTAERLAEHAIELGRAHGRPSLRATAGPLRQRFAAAKARIREAYDILARDERSRRDPSPAEEWLLDNSHVVDDQIREIHEDLPWGYLVQLPRLSSGAMRGYPRVYGLCLDYLRHTDAHLDLGTLSAYVRAYQTVNDLTIGELWAVPIMLRLGLILTVGALASSEANARDRARADAFADRLLESAATREGARAALHRLERDERSPSDAFLVQLLRRLREHDAPSVEVSDWIAAQCAQKGTTPEELARKQHLRQAADQVSVGNSITSMRQIAALDWGKFFEQVSNVEALLAQDPSGAHTRSDDATRDRCRHAVEKIARRSRRSEAEVAEIALSLAREAMDQRAAAAITHVGYYLVDAGRKQLERRVGYRLSPAEWVTRPVLEYPSLFFLGGIALLSGLLAWLAVAVASTHAPGLAWLVLALALVPASEIAVSIVNSLSIALLPPRLLPKLSLEEGIPKALTTLVAVPSLLDSESTLKSLLEDLEVRSLANPERNLYFALLTDFTDADAAEREGDARLLELARAGIAELNARCAGGEEYRFWLLHRRRLFNPVEGKFMGWERKRGKLEELNRLLRGAQDTSFSHVSGPRELLRSVRYVITLDADTELPRDVARKLVGTLAHPLNQALIDPEQRRVVRGHGILQPRVGTLPLSSRRSRFARIFAGPPGIDPYTTAVSDVYQDLFGEGSFVGKGIYDVDVFRTVLDGRTPENTLLSHDLFEGNLTRSALVTDIEVLDEQPGSYAVVASRQHRWMRGDWQLLPWLLPRVPSARGSVDNPFRPIDTWKFVDNLRRSLLPPTLIAFALCGWFAGGGLAVLASAAIALVFLAPLACRAVLDALRGGNRSQSRLAALGGDLKANSQQLVLGVAFLVDQALLSLDAIGRTLFRLGVSRRSLLEWTTMSQASQRFRRRGGVEPRMWLAFGASLVAFALLSLYQPGSLQLAVPALSLWALAPFMALWLSKPEPVRDKTAELNASDRRMLRVVARKTWRFFDVFVGDEDHHLPPDNYQEDPRGVVAHRTSPTNIGLYLLSVVAARDFGFVSLAELCRRIDRTLGTLERLEKRNGHILNWYETNTLRPLEPQYVSTVDSGNLAGYLWTLRESSADMARARLLDEAALEAARDALHLCAEQLGRGKAHDSDFTRRVAAFDRRLAEALQRFGGDAPADYALLCELATGSALLASSDFRDADAEARYWLEQAATALQQSREEVAALAPFLKLLDSAPTLLQGGALGEAWAELRHRSCRALSLSSLATIASELGPRVAELGRHVDAAATSASERAATLVFLQEVGVALQLAEQASSKQVEALSLLGARAGALGDGMDFRFLFDEERCLFSIGYNVGSMRLDGSHYDLLASEARLASLLSVAKGDAPQEHWFRAGRPRTVVGSRGVLLSWSGSMFEYLMPLLVTDAYSDTLLDETYESCVFAQRKYAAEKGVPWGISEAAYNVMDLSMTYQYRAFGVPGLGLKAGLGEDLVVAPYATALALLVEPKLAAQNLRALSKEGLDAGLYGFYESIDYTPAHLPPGRRSVIVKAYMAHHQGMTLVALDNVLHGMPMRRRFHAEPRIKASALLLEERLPTTAPVVEVRATQIAPPLPSEPEVYTAEHVGLGAPGQRVHLLGHGELSTLVAASGAGFTSWKGLDVNRFREDAALDPGGVYVYVRDRARDALWSAAHLPTARGADFYDAAFHIDRVAIHRRDGAIETLTEIVVSPEHPAEVRRITLTNHGDSDTELDITTYTELSLAPRAVDTAHPAFSSMFIETEALPARGALLAQRRPRSATEAPVWLVQVLSPEGDGFSELEFDTSRTSFIGRGGTLAEPRAIREGARLGENVGCVLDPAFALRRRVKLAAGARVSLTLTTALASSRDAALELVEIHSTPHHAERTFGLAFADARVELKHLGITATQSHRFQRLLSAALFAPSSLRGSPDSSLLRGKGKSALWAQGISGDLPIVILRIDDADFAELCRELLLAHEFFRLNGQSLDLVLLNEEPSGYLLPMQDAVLDLVRGSPAQAHLDQRGGVFVRRAPLLDDSDRALLLASARVVLRASQGTLAQQLRKAALAVRPWPQRSQASRAPRQLAPVSRPRPELWFDNGLGGFSRDGREYVMLLDRARRTPLPWCNVMANPSFGTLVSESGSGCTWFGNSQRHRLTPWSNDATRDPSGEVLYLRDEEDGTSWSLTPAPAGGDVEYLVRHGMGYTHFEHERAELGQRLSVFVSARDPVKFFRVKLSNRGSRARKLSLFGVVEWVLGGSREAARLTTVTHWDASRRALSASNSWAVFPEHRGVFFSTHAVASVSADREEWFGRFGSRERPAALERVGLSGHTGIGLDPCAALQLPIELQPGQELELSLMLADAESDEHARSLVERYGDITQVNAAWDELNQHWQELLGAVQVKTPDRAFDLMSNGWLLYQALSCRIWARTAFYQSSGAYGYRDQVQDVLALLHTRPELARQHLLRAAARQFAEGDVQHWWHPETGEGIRSRCSDDLLWLPFATSHYVLATGDRSILEESVPVLEERQLGPNENDLFGSPPASREGISLYEHCVRALLRGTTEGPRGLPRMGGGDWNDGMNRVGREGQGESVWLGWFLAKTLRDFALVAKLSGDAGRAVWCVQQATRVGQAIDAHAWDGAWYRRAFFDDGTPLGTAQSSECQIDAIAQSWAVISGAADPARAELALQSAERRLVVEDQQLMRLLTPPFERAEPDPGYIRSYPPGVRENGGQYTHGVLWTVLALCTLGEGDRAFRLMSLLNPVQHADSPEGVARYRVEPYVVAADVYSSAQHPGRGGWTWYTGSASWMYRDMIEGILGLRKEHGRLCIAPCIPSDWPGFEVIYRYGRSELEIVVENPERASGGVVELSVDERIEPSGSVPLIDDGRRRRVRAVIRRAVQPAQRRVSGS
ncbi:MAG: glucoamylase family protein [Polyangiaceae bacterium]